MVAAKENSPRFTPEEYFAWEEQQLERHEYINGEVYAMSGESINHSDIAGNSLILLNSDARVNIVESTNYVYPDISVTCNERDQITTQYITYPCLIVEVLSPTTEAYDRGNKFRMYRQNPSLQEYVLVDADAVEIEMFRKNDGDNWRIINYQSGDLVELKSVNLTFPIEDVYEGIIFE
jgi:Uma2 family endonuclease